VKDGLSNKKSVDLNQASKDELTSLPGVTPNDADAQIQDRVVVNR
jgi:DNA uptake protein ComE-like DNA-binding protein